MLKLVVHNAKDLDRNAKCTVHSNGKLGFSDAAAKKLGLEKANYLIIASNEAEADENLYMWVDDTDLNGGFKVFRAGNYFYINTKLLFDKQNIDYANKEFITIFDITDINYEDKNIYKLIKRVQKRAKKEKNKTDAVDN